MPIKPNMWHWTAGINSHSANKDAAWLFLQWASSKPTCILTAAAGLATPRASAWASSAFNKRFGEQASRVALTSLKAGDGDLFKKTWFHPKGPIFSMRSALRLIRWRPAQWARKRQWMPPRERCRPRSDSAALQDRMYAISAGRRTGARPFRSGDVAARDRRRFLLLMLAPATTLLVGLTIIPFVVSVVFSFSNYSLVTPHDFAFVGLGNYARLIASGEFWNALRITVAFTLAAVALELVVGVGVAALLHQETRGAPALRIIYLLPLAVTPVAAVFSFRIMLNPSLGVFNYLLRQIGLPPQDWLGTPAMAFGSLVGVDAWQWTPFILLIAAGGLSAMDEEPLEAARMDGAGSIAVFFHHSLPMLFPYLAVAIVFRSIDAFKTFDIIFVLTGGGPGIATRTLNLLAYKQGIEFLSMGYAAAIAIVMLLITLAASQGFLRRIDMFRPKATL